MVFRFGYAAQTQRGVRRISLITIQEQLQPLQSLP
ncbi:unnamed protein product (plasmid) [Mycetohabitans rhizoxinica HKI 454]|uniref:Uncharacterized protein n=1 Tax=Mycetohabitans rhizoxinica (strain DSM 19002 / CIP 109453 / HKI 454) TaxID=882378 RepID=E5AU24_MYCRK|nr:unnamed protein product [Mycetohabitans rhizoxinica HKI 454]